MAVNNLSQKYMRIRFPWPENQDGGWIHESNTDPPPIGFPAGGGGVKFQVRATVKHTIGAHTDQLALMRDPSELGIYYKISTTSNNIKTVSSDYITHGQHTTKPARLGGENDWEAANWGQMAGFRRTAPGLTWDPVTPHEMDCEFSMQINESAFIWADQVTLALRVYEWINNNNQKPLDNGYDATIVLTLRRYAEIKGAPYTGPFVGADPYTATYVNANPYLGSVVDGSPHTAARVGAASFINGRVAGVSSLRAKEH